ncbi:MAG: hypothetical protein PVF33_06680, partial [Candidatus Latescibacterota bacterium]
MSNSAVLLSAIAGLFISTALNTPDAAHAQIPETINHQGKLIDDSGDPIDGFVIVHFSLYDVETEGTPIWNEDHGVEVVDGLFEVFLGSEEPFDDVPFSTPLWLGVSVNDGDEMEPRLPLSAVPYSLRAKRVDASAFAAGNNVSLTNEGDVIRISALLPDADTLSSLDALDGDPTGALIVDTEGRVGIGTGSPGFQLEVVGDVGLSGNTELQGNVTIAGSITAESSMELNGDLIATGNLIAGGAGRLIGDLYMEDDMGSIRFASPTPSSRPMMEMFPSGTNNPTRMVLGHSQGLPDWGISYDDGIDAFNWLAGGSPVLTVRLENRRVGIGTVSPSDRLHVKGDALVEGDLAVTGKLSKSVGSVRIDHPLDPANRYLYHSLVESPDMMNVYNGTIVLDENGEATVSLPEYFEAL